MRFRSGVIVITGASGGVGRATAREFAKRGATIVLLARGQDGLTGTKREVEAAGGRGIVIPLDVSNARQLRDAADTIEREVGPINIWINNAMNSVFSPFNQITPEEFQRVTEVTYLGQVYGTMAALPYMRKRDRGSIVLVGSALAYRGIPLQSAYCGAKHGVKGFFDSLRCELIHENSHIRLSMVQLPALNTTQFGWVKSRLPNEPKPMGKVYEPEVAARAIVYAALHSRREYYVGFPTFKAIIGNKIAPGFLDHYLAKNGYRGQQTDQLKSPDRKNNLWEPVPGDQGTYGRFSSIAHSKSFTWWMSTHRGVLVATVLIVITVLGWLVMG